MIIFKIIAAKELTTAKFLAKNNKRSTCILALNAFVQVLLSLFSYILQITVKN